MFGFFTLALFIRFDVRGGRYRLAVGRDGWGRVLIRPVLYRGLVAPHEIAVSESPRVLFIVEVERLCYVWSADCAAVRLNFSEGRKASVHALIFGWNLFTKQMALKYLDYPVVLHQ